LKILEVYKNLRALIEEYFDKKLKHSGYYGLQEIWDIVDDCTYDAEELVSKYDKRIDDFITEMEEKREQEKEELKGKGIFI
jgi:hypothetical protein